MDLTQTVNILRMSPSNKQKSPRLNPEPPGVSLRDRERQWFDYIKTILKTVQFHAAACWSYSVNTLTRLYLGTQPLQPVK